MQNKKTKLLKLIDLPVWVKSWFIEEMMQIYRRRRVGSRKKEGFEGKGKETREIGNQKDRKR